MTNKTISTRQEIFYLYVQSLCKFLEVCASILVCKCVRFILTKETRHLHKRDLVLQTVSMKQTIRWCIRAYFTCTSIVFHRRTQTAVENMQCAVCLMQLFMTWMMYITCMMYTCDVQCIMNASICCIFDTLVHDMYHAHDTYDAQPIAFGDSKCNRLCIIGMMYTWYVCYTSHVSCTHVMYNVWCIHLHMKCMINILQWGGYD